MADIIKIDGIDYISADKIKRERRLGENAFNAFTHVNSFPKPVRISRVRFYEPDEIEQWFTTNTTY